MTNDVEIVEEEVAESSQDFLMISIESEMSKLQLGEDDRKQSRGPRAVDETLFIQTEQEKFLAPVQVFAINDYTQQDVSNLIKLFQIDQRTFELIQL